MLVSLSPLGGDTDFPSLAIVANAARTTPPTRKAMHTTADKLSSLTFFRGVSGIFHTL